MDYVHESESITVLNQSVKVPCGSRHRGPPMLVKISISLSFGHGIELGFFSQLQKQWSDPAEQPESKRFELCRFL